MPRRVRLLPCVLVLMILAATTAFVYRIHSPIAHAAGLEPPRFQVMLWPHSAPHHAGIGDRVIITSNVPESPAFISRHLRVRPAISVKINAVSSHRFIVRPVSSWPGLTTITIALELAHAKAVSDTFETDANKRLLIDLSSQRLLVFEDDRLIRLMPVSTGVPPTWTTPNGTFWIFRKVADDHMKGGLAGSPDAWDVEHVPWAQYIYRGIAIHGAWWNRQFGIARSHGCIQLRTRTFNPRPGDSPDDAQWLYQFTDIGTPVLIIGQTPPLAKAPLRYPVPDHSTAWPTVARYDASSTQ